MDNFHECKVSIDPALQKKSIKNWWKEKWKRFFERKKMLIIIYLLIFGGLLYMQSIYNILLIDLLLGLLVLLLMTLGIISFLDRREALKMIENESMEFFSKGITTFYLRYNDKGFQEIMPKNMGIFTFSWSRFNELVISKKKGFIILSEKDRRVNHFFHKKSLGEDHFNRFLIIAMENIKKVRMF